MYPNFANLFSKLSVSTFYKLISKFQQKVQQQKISVYLVIKSCKTLNELTS